MDARARWLPRLWALALTVLLLWPALGRGVVLSYDMVWVPDLALRPDFLGVGPALPRAVPSDAVVAVLDELLPGMLLQKVVLLGAVLAGGCGAAELVRSPSLPARLSAVSVYVWSAYVVERAVLGQWPLLLALAVLPWLLRAAVRTREQGRLTVGLPTLLVVGSLSAVSGLACAVLTLAFGWRRRGTVRWWLVAAVLAANAPWLVAGLLHAPTATSSALGARVFALHDEGSVPGPLAALTSGGVWNAEVVPASRTGAAGWLALLLVGLAVLGVRGWLRVTARRDVAAYVGCWLVGWLVAVVSYAAPGPAGVLAAHVPGAGLLRDGSRLLLLGLPLAAVTCGHGAAALSGLVRSGAPRVALAVACVLLPLALMPDAAGGSSGRLGAVEYPMAYDALARAVARQHGPGDLLVLPFTSYRAPAWNHHRSVLDPTGRHQPRDYVASDDLVVSGQEVPGEDPRDPAVRAALRRPTAQQRSRDLARAGVGLVVSDRSAPGHAPAVSGRVVLRSGALTLTRLGDVRARRVPGGWWPAMALAWLLFLAGPVTDLARRLRTPPTMDDAERRTDW